MVVLTGGSSKTFAKLLRLRDRDEHRQTAPMDTPPVRQRQLTVAEREELIASYLAGERTTALAAQFGTHRSNVSLTLKHAGVLKPLAKLTEAQVDEAMALRVSGLFYRQIAERFGVDTETARRGMLKRQAAEDHRSADPLDGTSGAR